MIFCLFLLLSSLLLSKKSFWHILSPVCEVTKARRVTYTTALPIFSGSSPGCSAKSPSFPWPCLNLLPGGRCHGEGYLQATPKAETSIWIALNLSQINSSWLQLEITSNTGSHTQMGQKEVRKMYAWQFLNKIGDHLKYPSNGMTMSSTYQPKDKGTC